MAPTRLKQFFPLGLLFLIQLTPGYAFAGEIPRRGSSREPVLFEWDGANPELFEPLHLGDSHPAAPYADRSLAVRNVLMGRQFVCEDPGNGLCPNRRGCCPIGGDCCPNGCCKAGEQCCGTSGCCAKGASCWGSSHCCADGWEGCRGGGCCAPGTRCVIDLSTGQRGCQKSGGSNNSPPPAQTSVLSQPTPTPAPQPTCTRSGDYLCADQKFCCPKDTYCFYDKGKQPKCWDGQYYTWEYYYYYWSVTWWYTTTIYLGGGDVTVAQLTTPPPPPSLTVSPPTAATQTSVPGDGDVDGPSVNGTVGYSTTTTRASVRTGSSYGNIAPNMTAPPSMGGSVPVICPWKLLLSGLMAAGVFGSFPF